MGVMSFGLSHEDAEENDDWRVEKAGNFLTQVYLEDGHCICDRKGTGP